MVFKNRVKAKYSGIEMGEGTNKKKHAKVETFGEIKNGGREKRGII